MTRLKTGDLVRVEGGYFKSDNGLFRVIHSPGDKDWLGIVWCLHRANKDGSLSKGKNAIAFWPLKVTAYGDEKRRLAKKHNAIYATIEIVTPA